MPSSTHLTLTEAVKNILQTQPESILDVGIGFGKWGFLCREYLETWKDHVFPDQWLCKIEGIEIFEPYTTLDHIPYLYDNIHIGDAHKILPTLDNFDMIIAMDVVEHLTKDKGIELCKTMLSKFNKTCLINVPTGNWLENVVIAGNKAEQHQAIWENEDLIYLGEQANVNLTLYEWKQGNRTGCMGVYKK